MDIERDVVAGAVVIVCVAFGVLQKMGLVRFGKGKCGDIECHDTVKGNERRIKALEECQIKIFERLDKMPERVVTLLKDTKGLL